MTTVSIRDAILDDIPVILALELHSASAAHWTAEQYGSRVQSGTQDACFLVAECDNRICGFLCAHIVAGEWEIENVVVAEKFRRRGLGAELMRSLIDKWEHSPGIAVFLEVRESNAAARALYAKFAFQEAGRRRVYYQQPVEDSILYARRRSN